MFLTVTTNSALDRNLFIEEFVPGKTMRTGHYMDSIGGKGFSVSMVLKTLGAESLALAMIAGQNGEVLARRIAETELNSELIWVEGETRIAHTIVETHPHRHSHIISGGYDVTTEECEKLLEALSAHIHEADWVIAGGSLPAGAPRDLYAIMCGIAKKAGKPIAIDCFGPPAAAACRAQPDLFKMNRRELALTYGLPASSLDEVRHSAQAIRNKFSMENFIVTCGEEGIIGITSEGSFHAIGPRQAEVNAAGAGDAVTAALVWRRGLGDNWEEALRWACACGAATVLTRGTAEMRMPDVERILDNVRVNKYETHIEG